MYVFDTSALIERPEMVRDLEQDELAVVTKRIIDELDDKKLDDDLRPRVASGWVACCDTTIEMPRSGRTIPA